MADTRKLDCCHWELHKTQPELKDASVEAHCRAGLHCIYTTHSCVIELENETHPEQCCGCHIRF